jgi:hypothetical protein
LALIAFSCDQFHEDEIAVDKVVTIDPTQTEYYVGEYVSNPAIVINLRTLVTTTFETISIRVTEYPKYGKVSYLSDFFLKYAASETFYQDAYYDGALKDQFVISFFRDGKTIAKQTISIIIEDFACSLYAVEDRFTTNPGTSKSWTVTWNDRFCDIKTENVQASIALEPQHGHVELEGFTVTYTPETGYEGPDEFVYELKATGQENIDSEGPLFAYGLVTVNISK